jgi:endo-1,4-beta-xylanase
LLRRSCLKHLGVISCSAAVRRAFSQSVQTPVPVTVVPSLSEIAAKRGILYGATPEVEVRRTVPEYRDLLTHHCKLIAPILSWASVSKAPGEYEIRWQPTLDFCQAHGMKITGAHLLWHESTPKFFEAAADSAQARKLVVDHITYMGKRLAGQVWSWNVVNEALNPREGRPGGLRGSPLLSQLGNEFFDIAFHTAREADPNAVLVYNDYAFELDTSDQEARRRALLALLDSFKKRNLPIDAIGLQCHMRLDRFKFQPQIYRQFLKDIAARGVKILITELDVFDIGAPSDIQERDQAVADCYQRVLEVALDETAVTALVTWGLSDRYSWLTSRSRPNFARPDGLPGRPLPFDEQFQAKPAYRAIAKALAGAPMRKSAG